MFLLFITVAGSDYDAVVGELLVFTRGQTRSCHTINITEDVECELEAENESFFSDLALVSGIPNITVEPSTAEVIVSDTDEPECGKYLLM